MLTVSIACDHCARDLLADNPAGYRIELVPERAPPRLTLPRLVHSPPPVERVHHFCNLACLGKWAAEHART